MLSLLSQTFWWSLLTIFISASVSSPQLNFGSREIDPRHNYQTSTSSKNTLNTSPWVGWNWNAAPATSRNNIKFGEPDVYSAFPEEAKRWGQSEAAKQDWRWRTRSVANSYEADRVPRNSFQLHDPHHYVQGTDERPTWLHEETYDPYSYHGGNRGHETTVNLRRPSYEWQTLQGRPPMLHFHSSTSSSNRPEEALQSHIETTNLDNDSQFTSSASASAQNGHPVMAASSDRNRKYSPDSHPQNYYKRRRYRLAIHPGFIAAPIAGLAAFGAVHAFTSNPLLLELGLVDKSPHPPNHPNKPLETHHHHEHSHHHIHPVPVPVHAPHPTHPPHHHHHHHPRPTHSPGNHGGQGSHGHHPEIDIAATFPILIPHPQPHPHPTQKPSTGEGTDSKPWWSPFAAIIPRLRLNEPFERD